MINLNKDMFMNAPNYWIIIVTDYYLSKNSWRKI